MDILILVFFLCISVKYKWCMLLCLCVYVLGVLDRERELFLERHYEETLVAS